jgi:hypothetical protein
MAQRGFFSNDQVLPLLVPIIPISFSDVLLALAFGTINLRFVY